MKHCKASGMLAAILVGCGLNLALADASPAQQSPRVTLPDVIGFEEAGHAELYAAMERGLGGSVLDGALSIRSEDRPPGHGSKYLFFLDGEGARGVFADLTTDYGAAPEASPGEQAQQGTRLLRGPALFIRHSPAGAMPESFMTLSLGPGEAVASAWVANSVVQQISTALPERFGASAPLRVAARETETGAEFFIDGESVGTLADSRIGGSGLGIGSFGSGTFVFDNVGLNRAGDIGADGVADVAAVAQAPSASPSDPPAGGQVQPFVVEPPAPDLPPPLPPMQAPPVQPFVPVFVAENGQPVGPLTEPDLRGRIAAGSLTETTLVWRQGMDGWKPAVDVADIAPLFSAAAAAGAPQAGFVLDPGFDTGGGAEATGAGIDQDAVATGFDATRYLLGAWQNRGKVTVPGLGPADANLTLTIRQDGTFGMSGSVQLVLPGGAAPVAVQLRSAGTWSTQEATGDRITLLFDQTLTMEAPAAGIPAQEERTTETTTYQIVDGNTMRDDEATWVRSGS